jgi:hypothetical protein
MHPAGADGRAVGSGRPRMVDRVRGAGAGDGEEEGYYRERYDAHGGSDTLASVMLRSLRCSMFEPIPGQ